MYKQGLFTVAENKPLTASVYEMVLEGDTQYITAPGQFVNLQIDGLFLRRPISVCDWAEGRLKLVYKVVGKGTEAMAKMVKGDVVDVLTGLGNGYLTEKSGANPVLLGGGVGVPPLYGLAKRLIAEGKSVSVILGFNKREEVFYEQQFKDLGASVTVTTVDGSYGVKGFVTDALAGMEYTHHYTCGPEPMLKAVYRATEGDGSYSFEERMGCGFGACVGCTCKTKYGNKRICKDGPVLCKEEIIW